MKKGTYFIASLGCAKNTVDSESMAILLNREGYQAVIDPLEAEFLIVNTCGFIHDARQESLDVLQELSDQKQPGQILIGAGCLTQRFPHLVTDQIKKIDGVFGTRRWMDIVQVAKTAGKPRQPKPLYHLPDVKTIGKEKEGLLRAAVQGGSAYLKIADGCRRSCAYCAIPLIKGTQVSRPINHIIQDAQALQEMNVQELVLISQDTSDYGADFKLKNGLVALLKELVPAVPDIPWLRILYTFPGFVTDELIDFMAAQPQILNYLDLPLQHAHPDVLKRMNRPSNMEWVYKTIARMRSAMPDLAMRTTFIVGYPGETEEEFNFLLDFIQEMQFDHLGAFTFSFEEGTPSAPLGDPIPQEVKQYRWEQIMLLQEQISLAKNQAWIGKTLPVLIEGHGDGVSVGRSYRDAPEIDGLVIIDGEELPVGTIVNAQFTDALPHDMIAKLPTK
jgi:ribosomal protein S12 methylthiotransferase